MEVPQYRDRLINVYATHPVVEIENAAEFQTLLQQFAGDSNFRAERHRIEIAKTMVEGALDGEWTEQETVQKAIRHLINCRTSPKERDLCHELIVAGYWPKWIEVRQQYFDESWKNIQLEYDYFVSFTCRYPNPETPGGNPINREHKYFIMDSITVAEFRKSGHTDKNLLAVAIDRALAPSKQSNMRRFFFPVFRYDNSETKKKLENACNNSMVFVQIVQPIMFRPLDGDSEENYSYLEWKWMYNRLNTIDIERNMLFIVIMPGRDYFRETFRYPGYRSWYNHIEEKDPPYLPETATRDPSTLAEIKRIFEESLVPGIRSAWDRLVKDTP
jgi:hypothetical protein